MPRVLSVENISKSFRVRRNRARTVIEALTQRLTSRYDSGFTLWALRDVSFSLEQGRVLGVIGHNGAGKSTLLRLLCGFGRPSSGVIHVAGNIGSLLELGSGFHHDMTGRENLLTGGILSGLTRREIKHIEEEIISFAELEEFIDQPVRTYSSGMYMRLAFATAFHLKPDLLIIDEVLSVGDSRFQKKCLDRLQDFRAAGKSLVLVSHDLDQIRNFCEEVLVLEEGRVVMQGVPESAISCYHDLMRQRTEKRAAQISGGAQSNLTVERGSRMGTQEAVIDEVVFRDDQDKITDSVSSGSGLTVNLAYRLRGRITDFAAILGIYNESHVKCFETHLPSVRTILGTLQEGGCFSCYLPELPLFPGRYYIDVGLYPVAWDYTYDYHWQMHVLHIENRAKASPYHVSGVVSIDPSWTAPNRHRAFQGTWDGGTDNVQTHEGH
jgi:lipopolysaccharide transport system ATP-binding protein